MGPRSQREWANAGRAGAGRAGAGAWRGTPSACLLEVCPAACPRQGRTSMCHGRPACSLSLRPVASPCPAAEPAPSFLSHLVGRQLIQVPDGALCQLGVCAVAGALAQPPKLQLVGAELGQGGCPAEENLLTAAVCACFATRRHGQFLHAAMCLHAAVCL